MFPLVRPLKTSDVYQIRKHTFVAARKFRHHFPKDPREPLSLLAFGRDAVFLQSDRLVAQRGECVYHRQTTVLIKAAADAIERFIVKILDQPIGIVLHLQIYYNIGVFFKIDRFHLQNFRFQRLYGLQRLRKRRYFPAHNARLFRQGGSDFRGRIERGKPIFYLFEGKSQRFQR